MKRQSMVITVVVGAYFILPAGAAWEPYNKNHGPFEPTHWPEIVELKQCDMLHVRYSDNYFSRKFFYGLKDNPESPRLCLADRQGWQWSWLFVEDSDGNVISGPKVAYASAWPKLQVYCGQLNDDGRVDFVIRYLLGGCGTIFTFSCSVVFVLSDGGDYEVTPTTGLWSGLDYFLDIKGDGRCQFIHTRFVNGRKVKGRDGKSHNYWVYNLLEFQGGKVVVNNKLAPQFPRWIWYTFKPNHQDTTQLTEDQKQFLWSRYENPIFQKRQAEPIELRIPSNGQSFDGQTLIIRYDPIQSQGDYRAPAYCALPDTDPYVAARGTKRGLVRVVTDNNKQLKEYIVPKEELRAVVDVYFGKCIVEDYHFVFTDDKVVLIHRSNSNAGIFSGCDVYELPYSRTGFGSEDLLVNNSRAQELLHHVSVFCKTCIAPTLDISPVLSTSPFEPRDGGRPP